MVAATPGRLARLDDDAEEGVPVPTFAASPQEPVLYRRDVSSGETIGRQPLLPDPYEARTVYVAESGIAGAGEGLFARRDLAEGQLVALYNGVRVSDRESRLHREDRRSPYRIYGWGEVEDEVLNIPPRYRHTSQYAATLGHKANHNKVERIWGENLEPLHFKPLPLSLCI